jgi:hypothetical protein
MVIIFTMYDKVSLCTVEILTIYLPCLLKLKARNEHPGVSSLIALCGLQCIVSGPEYKQAVE